jgi:hypothetical protein
VPPSQESLHFHSLAHAQFSTALLAARIVDEQRQLQLSDGPDAAPSMPPKTVPRPAHQTAAAMARLAADSDASPRAAERAPHWMSGMRAAPARRAPPPACQPDASRRGGPPAWATASPLFYDAGGGAGGEYGDYADGAARGREGGGRGYGDVRGFDEDEGGDEDDDGGDVVERDADMSPPYEYDGLDAGGGPAGGRGYDRDAEDSGIYMAAPAPGPAGAAYARGAAGRREEGGRAAGVVQAGRGGKEVTDWFSVLVNAEVCARKHLHTHHTYTHQTPVNAEVCAPSKKASTRTHRTHQSHAHSARLQAHVPRSLAGARTGAAGAVHVPVDAPLQVVEPLLRLGRLPHHGSLRDIIRPNRRAERARRRGGWEVPPPSPARTPMRQRRALRGSAGAGGGRRAAAAF